jgi:hypothetical protein
MLAEFCARLACGLAAAMTLTAPKHVNLAFFRVHLLVTLGLLIVAALDATGSAARILWGGSAMTWLAFVQWTLGCSRAGRIGLAALTVFAGWAMSTLLGTEQQTSVTTQSLVSAFASSALLGTTLAAMLVGHWHVFMPEMPTAPLVRMLKLTAAAQVGRAAVAVWGLAAAVNVGLPAATGSFDDPSSLGWTTSRWIIGLALPAVFTWMTWRTAKIGSIRALQSATGILYASLVLTMIGELLALVVERRGGAIF